MKCFRVFITAITLLFLASGCAGTRPFFMTGKITEFSTTRSEQMTQHVKRYNDKYNYVPSPATEDEILNPSKGQYRFSVSFPASVKLSF